MRRARLLCNGPKLLRLSAITAGASVLATTAAATCNASRHDSTTRPAAAESSCRREDTIRNYVSEVLADNDFWSHTVTSHLLMGNTQAIAFVFRNLTAAIIDEFESSFQLAAPPSLFEHALARRVEHVPLHHVGVGLPWATCESVADLLLGDRRFQREHSRVVTALTHDLERKLIANMVRLLSCILVDVAYSSGAELAGLRLRWER